MSFNTALDYFTTAQNDVISPRDWSNITNVLAFAGSASQSLGAGSGERMLLTGPKCVSEIPGGVPLLSSVSITGFDFEVYHKRTNFGGQGSITDYELRFEGGTDKSGIINLTAPLSYETATFGGDLAFWGLTATQAEEVLAGTRYFGLIMQGVGLNGSETYSLQYIKMSARFEYAGVGLSVPRMF